MELSEYLRMVPKLEILFKEVLVIVIYLPLWLCLAREPIGCSRLFFLES
jgi:hypothetical protein